MFAPIAIVPIEDRAADRQQAFLAVLPKLEAHARVSFARIRCPHDRADAVAEAIASAWERFRFEPAPSADYLAAYAVNKVRSLRSRSRVTSSAECLALM